MNGVVRHESGRPFAPRSESLADVLERVLDKGVVIAGDVVVNVLDIELLTLKLRLLIASADTAKSMGIDWWESDPFLNSRAREEQDDREQLRRENDVLHRRLERLERALQALPGGGEPAHEGHAHATEQPAEEGVPRE